VKDSSDQRLRFYHLRNVSQGVTGDYRPIYPCKNADDRRVRLRTHDCDPDANVTDRRWQRGALWKEGALAAGAAASAGSTTVFTSTLTSVGLGWVNLTNPADDAIPTNAFRHYFLRWTGGANMHHWSHVTASAGPEFTLAAALPHAVSAGDTFELWRTRGARLRGRLPHRARVLSGTNAVFDILPGGRSKVYAPHTLFVKPTAFTAVANPLAGPHTPWPWFTFTNWAQVLSYYADWKTTVIDPSYVTPIMNRALFVAPLTWHEGVGAGRAGYIQWTGQFGAYAKDLPGSARILLGENTVFADTPAIPLPIRFYLEGVNIRMREPTFHSMLPEGGSGTVVGCIPFFGIQWIISAYDGAGNVLFDLNVAPYASMSDGFDEPFLPRFPLQVNWWGPFQQSPANSYPAHDESYLIGPLSTRGTQGISPLNPQSAWTASGQPHYPSAYASECQSDWTGNYRYEPEADGRPWQLDGVDYRYGLVLEVRG